MAIKASISASACGVVLGVAGIHPALAQDANAPQAIEEIVVTAQKRSENIQKVPLSIVAISGDKLRSANASSLLDLPKLVPNVQFTTGFISSSLQVRIRGFGQQGNNSLDPEVTPYIDGVYIPRTGALFSSFLDVKSVEVLRGPQGTLFGRNSVVGAISMSTNQPEFSKVEGYAAGQIGNYNTYQLDGVLNVPVSENVAVRAAVLGKHFGGYFHNLYDDRRLGEQDTYVARLAMKAALTPDLTLLIQGDYARLKGDGVNGSVPYADTAPAGAIANFASKFGNDLRGLTKYPTYDLNTAIGNPSLRDTQYGFSAHLDYDLPDAGTVRLISAYRNWKSLQNTGEGALTPLSIIGRIANFYSDSYSHELQYISPEDMLDDHLKLVGGVFYFHEKFRTTDQFDLGSDFCGLIFTGANLATCLAGPQTNATFQDFRQKARSFAAYLQGDIKIIPAVTLTLGARYTDDHKSATTDQVASGLGGSILRAPEYTVLSVNKKKPTYRANLTWNVTDNVILFGGYTTGYKSPAISSTAGRPALGVKRLLEAETSKNIEVGLKSTLDGGRVLFNATVFRTEVDDFQDRSFDGISFSFQNAGDIRSQGVEIEGGWHPTRHFALDAAFAYLDATYLSNLNAPGLPACTGTPTCPTTQNLSGKTLPFAPKIQFSVRPSITNIELGGDFTGTVRTNFSYTSHYLTTNDNNPQSVSPRRLLIDASVEVANEKGLKISIFGNNLTNRQYATYTFTQVLDSLFGVRDTTTGETLLRANLNDPRTFGIRVQQSF